MDILLWIIFGGIAGWVASFNEKTDERQALFGNTILVGIVGAVLGGFIMNIFGNPSVIGFNLYSFFTSIIGTIVLLWTYRAFTERAV